MNYQYGGENMEVLLPLGILLGGLGLFFTGIGVVWGVSRWVTKWKEPK
jgi:hypothetical protein